MRIIAFTITLFLGVYVASFFKSIPAAAPCNDVSSYTHRAVAVSSGGIKSISIKFDTSQNYSLAEAKALIGKQVRNLSIDNAKCPKDAGNCLNLYKGEMGQVVSILPSIENTYLIEIQWEETPKDYSSRYSGRLITRAGEEVSLEEDYSPQSTGAFVTRAGKEVSFDIVK